MKKQKRAKRTMVFRVGKKLLVDFVHDDLETWQKLVGGLIERLPLFKGVVLYCNEEGRLTGLPVNRKLKAVGTAAGGDFVHYTEEFPGQLARPGEPGEHIILGDFFVVRESNGGTVDLTDKDVAQIKKLFGEA